MIIDQHISRPAFVLVFLQLGPQFLVGLQERKWTVDLTRQQRITDKDPAGFSRVDRGISNPPLFDQHQAKQAHLFPSHDLAAFA